MTGSNTEAASNLCEVTSVFSLYHHPRRPCFVQSRPPISYFAWETASQCIFAFVRMSARIIEGEYCDVAWGPEGRRQRTEATKPEREEQQRRRAAVVPRNGSEAASEDMEVLIRCDSIENGSGFMLKTLAPDYPAPLLFRVGDNKGELAAVGLSIRLNALSFFFFEFTAVLCLFFMPAMRCAQKLRHHNALALRLGLRPLRPGFLPAKRRAVGCIEDAAFIVDDQVAASGPAMF
ncbi:hypothetical protein V8E54_009549 [Elaphomyces granulatus]